jgi:hypothetical protein
MLRHMYELLKIELVLKIACLEEITRAQLEARILDYKGNSYAKYLGTLLAH